MTDPFDTLREPVVPLAPRPAFARELRRRIAAELGPDPEETTMPVLAIREYTPARLHSLTPYLATSDPAGAIEWYSDVFGAVLLGDPIVMPDGRIGHAELQIGDSRIMLGQANEQHKAMPCGIYVYVPDTDATYKKALAAGGISTIEPVNQFYGDRNAGVRDQNGNLWWIGTHVEDVPPEELKKRAAAEEAKRRQPAASRG